jgi:protein involved in polysaccharide export with SLBB domain
MQNLRKLVNIFKYCTIVVVFLLSVFTSQQVKAQETSASQLAKVDVDSLSDEQISTYWIKAKAEGYSLDQLEVIAISKGMPASQFSKLKQRISELRYTDPNSKSPTAGTANAAEISNIEKFGLEGSSPDKVQKNPLFGYDFFSNPNISFTPNLNLATPATYQLGPGDEILIDIWGAAENNYRKKVDREGAIRMENIGPVYISGLSIDKAKEKIISYLKKIYSGIGASGNSYNKVYADVSLVGVRTVQVNIIGEVKVPGTYSLSALSTVLNALYAAGGPTEKGTFRAVKVIRGGQEYGEFDIYDYLINGSEKGNVMLRDQDIIIIKPYGSKIEVIGNVKRPGFYELKQGETISDLINYFSGFTSDAYQERLLLERVNGKQKEVSEIVLKEEGNFLLRDGDKLTVGKIIDRYENRVSIEGAVYRPGDYELTEGLSLSGLLDKASGLKDNAFIDRGVIYRTIDGVKQEILSFSVKEVLEKKTDIVLNREDKIIIFSEQGLKEKQSVSIDGAVNNPQTIAFVENMRVDDLIAVSGGFKDGADATMIDISRRLVYGDFKTISKNIKQSSSNNLIIEGSNDFFLEPYDRVSVRYLKGYTTQKNVSIQGEVAYPGNYSIVDKDERISNLIDKAGGFSPYAYLKGATIIRKVNISTQKEQMKLFESLIAKDSLVADETIAPKEFKIGIDLENIMAASGQKSKFDLILQEGDVLIIPSEKQTVEVRGEVLVPSLSRFDRTNSFKDYISNSGGFSEKAKKRKSYIIYANGDIRSTKSFFFFKMYPKVMPGALILVPQKAEKKGGMSVAEIIGITTALGTLGLLINAF